MKLPYKKRIQVAVELLSELAKQVDTISRSQAVELLRTSYQQFKIKPIKGKSTPPDIYDKELATLYVVGKYGLKLDAEMPELFDKVFYIEKALEEAVNHVLSGKYEEARELLKKVSSTGVVDSNIVARMLRIPLVKYILGFETEEYFGKVLKKTLEAFPEEEKTVKNYAKFYVSLKLAEMIYRGEIKTREEKEAYKKALAIRIGFPTSTPSDEYVRVVAKDVFAISDSMLNKVIAEQRDGKKKGASQNVQEQKQ